MKKLSIALLAIALLLPAGLAHAYAIYNHTDHKVCISHWYSMSGCDIKISPHSTHNGEHGAGLSRVWASYHTKENNYQSYEFSIPKGGYARIYDREVKIYNHHDKHEKTVDIEITD